ncbi:MAG: DUF1232 domain-containing protein [Anaerolineales bacterium]|nr:DUF1232 domain-containing protein [Anaerolineales bacterium]
MAEEKRNLLGPYIPQGNFVREAVQQLKLVYNLMLDERVPMLTKLIPLLSVGYLFFPADLLPDIFVGLGQLDDLAVVMLGMRLFLELAPPEVVREQLRRIVQSGHWSVTDNPTSGSEKPKSDGDIVEGSYREDG